MKVQQIMTRDVECIQPDRTLQEAASRMKALDVGALPVCGNNRLEGMITDRDIVVRAVAEGRDPRQEKVGEAMTRELACCAEDQEVEEAAPLTAPVVAAASASMSAPGSLPSVPVVL